MKSSFKYVVRVIIISLVAILIFQFYWLSKLYSSIEEQVSKDIIECIASADESDLFARMNIEDGEEHKSNISISKDFGSDDTPKDSIEEKKKSDKFKNFEEITNSVKQSIHLVVDSVYPINLTQFNNVLDSSLIANKINTELCYLQIVNLKTDSILQTSASQKEIAAFGKTQQYIYKITDDGRYAYSVHFRSLTYTILVRMAGILVCTLLIIIILSFAFYYLIKTVLRQKTLEEMKDNFVNSMTHELKTPIAVAYSITDTLLYFKQGDDKEKRNKYLTICKDQLSGLSGLVEQILSMSMERREGFVLNKSNIVVEDLINNLAEHHRLKANKDIKINISPSDLIIYADPVHFSNIISNLIDNAIKYSGDDICIDIKISKTGKFYTISVSDNGMGIAPEKQAYVFDKFYRVSDGNKYQIKGYGLGLFYVKTMVEKHDGTIAVSSKINQGTTFTINIPTTDNNE